jgi:oligoendopeptidase F
MRLLATAARLLVCSLIMASTTIPSRAEVKPGDTWDLSRLFSDDGAWAAALAEYEKVMERAPGFRGRLGASAEALADFMDFSRDSGILEERLNYYTDLRQTEDEANSEVRGMTGRFMMAYAKNQAALSWAVPEIQAIPDTDMAAFLGHPRLSEYKIYLSKLLRFKPYVLSEKEEKIIALHSEAESVPGDAFSLLTNADMSYGEVETPGGVLPVSQSTYSVFMENPDREIRRKAYGLFYGSFEAHKNTIAALYSGSVKQDVIHARIRGYPSARAAALFPDKVDEAVYDNLVAAVNANLGFLHRYYALRKKALRLDELRHYDMHIPLVPAASRKTPWNEAVEMVSAALAPLGDEYTGTLRAGLLGRWADRYENKGKRSGAFSAGSYTGDPYILMNYKDDAIRDVFTMAHEGGHSMHSWYSARANPFMQYNYTIFEAEVASTFNEELLFRYLVRNAETVELRTYIINKHADDLLATLYRQTMFAEFEKKTHELEESGTPLTVDILRGEYRRLLEKYFGPGMVLEEVSDLEGLRIPHFYRAFYVYKYATGVSASLALAERVLGGGPAERADYFSFLRSGGSRFPMESLKIAGVDMSEPAPVEAACKVFGALVAELEKLVG